MLPLPSPLALILSTWPREYSTPALKPRAHRVVHAPLGAEGLADLADGAVGPERFAHRREEIRLPAGSVANGVERPRSRVGVPLGPDPGRPLELASLRLRVDPMQLDLLDLFFGEAVDADDRALAALDLLLPLEGGLLDLVLHEAPLDRLDGAAELVHALDQLPGASLELVRQRLDEVRAAERIGRVDRAPLGRENLLRAQRELRGAHRRQRECFVEPVRVQRLRTAADGGERLDRNAHDVVLRLLCRQRRAACLRVKAERESGRVRGAEALSHDPRPQTPRRAKLRHLDEEVVVRVEEER